MNVKWSEQISAQMTQMRLQRPVVAQLVRPESIGVRKRPQFHGKMTTKCGRRVARRGFAGRRNNLIRRPPQKKNGSGGFRFIMQAVNLAADP